MEIGDIVNKAVLFFLLLFLWEINNVALAGEYLEQGYECMKIKHQYDAAEKYLTLAIENGDNPGGLALLHREINYESGLKNYNAAIDDYTDFLKKIK